MGSQEYINTPQNNRLDAAFICVLQGDKYPVEYVHRLREGIQTHSPVLLPFYCITDKSRSLSEEIQVVEENREWGGWWQKISLFRPGLIRERFLIYFDLDTVLLKSLKPLLAFVGPWDFAYAQDPLSQMSSSLMIIDSQSRFARDVFSNFKTEFCQEYGDDQDHFEKFIFDKKYKTTPLPASFHYSYKCLADTDGWRSRIRNPDYAVPSYDEILTLNFHGDPKPSAFQSIRWLT